jgi:hypothetical protein
MRTTTTQPDAPGALAAGDRAAPVTARRRVAA